jgi:UDP-N-acetyl-D-mannosaminuronic acid dehydrogenase
VGLPLGLALASRGLDVVLYDIDERSVATVSSGTMPFDEAGAPALLTGMLASDRIRATSSPAAIADAELVVVVVGTPIDDDLRPDIEAVPAVISAIAAFLRNGQLLVLRGTVYPGVTAAVERTVSELGLEIDVACCPERIAEGKALVELFQLPQVVGARSPRALERARELFCRLTEEIVELEPEEAELGKLFMNTWRYITFAASNQLSMVANDHGFDYERIRAAFARNYPRGADLPRAGFAAGPCMVKDTMQLATFADGRHPLGRASLTINEGLPHYIVGRLEQRFDLPSMCVGVLGMAFKGGSDDTRSSLSYVLKRLLETTARRVVTHDPHVTSDPDLVDLDTVLRDADLLVIGAPHAMYRDLEVSVPVVDVWNLRDQGVQV